MRVDYTPEPDLDTVAGYAVDLYQRMVDSPHRLYGELVELCAEHPAKAAQLLMCHVAWFNPEVPCTELWRRVEDVNRRVGRAAS